MKTDLRSLNTKHSNSQQTFFTGLEEASLPRQRKQPRRFDNNQTATTFTSIEDLYRQQFFEAIDLTLNCIKSRFSQPGMEAHIALEDAVIKSSKRKDVSELLLKLKSFYDDDFDYSALRIELDMLGLADAEFKTADDFLKWINNSRLAMYPQLGHIAKLLLLMPASNAVSERSFSAMGRVKTALRSAMGQSRLNTLMLLHVHSYLTDKIEHSDVIKEFISCHPRRALHLAK